MKIFIKTEDEIELMRQANQIVAKTLSLVGSHIKPGITTAKLDKIADEFIRDHGAKPVFKGYPNHLGQPFSGSICTSLNSIVVHGVPSEKCQLKNGDILSVDCGVELNGFHGDCCYTFAVGEISDELRQLLSVTKRSLYLGIEKAQAGNHIGDISSAIQDYCEKYNFGIVREFTGHGIGKSLHEDPAIPNYGKRGNGTLLKNGMCLAIEPMITLGKPAIAMLPDKWSIITRDNQPAAHFEHTIAIRNGKADILSSFDEIEKIEGQNF